MAKKNLILLSLEDSKINKIANVVSNDSCKKILDFLADKDATESELAEKLKIPISTVHYNLQQLMDAGLVTADEYHYSEKGREVNHYKLANKYIIIAPKKTKTFGLKQKLKNILPVALITAGAAGLIQLTTKFIQKPTIMTAKQAVAERTFDAVPMAAEKAVVVAAEEAPAAAPLADVAVHTAPLWQNIALWFLIGAIFTIIIFLILSYFKKNND
jgi:DNA-binding transcriptional ArsR family regulator